MMVSMSIVCGFFTNPETCTVHGRVFNVCAFFAGSLLSVPNS